MCFFVSFRAFSVVCLTYFYYNDIGSIDGYYYSCTLMVVFIMLQFCKYSCNLRFIFIFLIVGAELKRSLYCLFSQYGRILDVVALKTSRLRGQAWIVFDEITAASSALRQMQGFPFYDKPMVRRSPPSCVCLSLLLTYFFLF